MSRGLCMMFQEIKMKNTTRDMIGVKYDRECVEAGVNEDCVDYVMRKMTINLVR